MEGARRKRFRSVRKRLPVIDDDLDFRENISSRNARHDDSFEEKITVEVWFDKHYVERYQYGDDNGLRKGIDPEFIRVLVKQSAKPLFLFSMLVKGFRFVNHVCFTDLTRVVIRKKIDDSWLNVVLQSSFKNESCLEVTVITAMVVNDFRLAAGQYLIDLQEGSACLNKFDNGKLQKVCAF